MDHWNFAEKQRPIIWLEFAQMDYRKQSLEEAITLAIREQADKNALTLKPGTLSEQFRNLIHQMAGDGKVVILIDEYDKPIIDHLGDPDQLRENQEVLRSLYSVLKPAHSTSA